MIERHAQVFISEEPFFDCDVKRSELNVGNEPDRERNFLRGIPDPQRANQRGRQHNIDHR